MTLAQDNFHALLEAYFNSMEPTSIQKMGWERYLKLGLPTKKTEVFRYLKLRTLFDTLGELAPPKNLTEKELAPYILPECSQSVLVFVNGHFLPSKSQMENIPSKVSISPLTDAIQTYGTFLMNHWQKTLNEEEDPFVAINTALHQGGAFLYIPPKTTIKTPIQILHILTGPNTFSAPRLQCFVGAESKVCLISSHASFEGDKHLINLVNDFHCEEGSQVSLYQAVLNDLSGCRHLEATRVSLKKEGKFNSVKATPGSAVTRYDYKGHLIGENSEISISSLGILKGSREAHDHVSIRHYAPHCRSNQLFKNVLFDRAHSSFEGKIYVEREAQRTEAYQLNANLLLSEEARAESKPNLEIFADDVSASHGATFGQLEEEEIFYLKTRGLSEEVAKNSLVKGYCKEVADLMGAASLRNRTQVWI